MNTESTTGQTDHNHDRELVRAITHVLTLAVGKRAAHQALRHAQAKAHSTARRRVARAAAHLAGYSALLGYIWHQRRASHQSAA
jgi:hypothetical protein